MFDPGSGSEIRDPEWKKIRIWDKHPGSATLQFTFSTIGFLCEAQIVGSPRQKDHNMIQKQLEKAKREGLPCPSAWEWLRPDPRAI
jgi:hypothetical protein